MSWLLTGGAGYVGSHVVIAFRAAGTDVVVLDNLSTGSRSNVPAEVPFVQASVTDADAVGRTLDEHRITGVMHLAGRKAADVSVAEPLAYYRANVTGMQVLLEAVIQRGLDRFILSSSASWYGTPTAQLVTEDEPARPESPYGQTKVVSEWLLRDVAHTRPTLRQTSLRYFNVVGAGAPHLADRGQNNLFPRVLRALTAGERPSVYGADYPTPDGSCVRDYVHVADIADAHVAVARRLDAGQDVAAVYNLGRGEGASVLQVLDAMRRITGIELPPRIEGRRAGDPARVVGAVDRIAADLGWRASRNLDDMVASAWWAWQHQPAAPA